MLLNFQQRIAIKKRECERLKEKYLNERYDYFTLVEAHIRYAFEHCTLLNEAQYHQEQIFFANYHRAYTRWLVACEQLLNLKLLASKNSLYSREGGENE